MADLNELLPSFRGYIDSTRVLPKRVEPEAAPVSRYDRLSPDQKEKIDQQLRMEDAQAALTANPRSVIGEGVNALKRGVMVELPRMGGQELARRLREK